MADKLILEFNSSPGVIFKSVVYATNQDGEITHFGRRKDKDVIRANITLSVEALKTMNEDDIKNELYRSLKFK